MEVSYSRCKEFLLRFKLGRLIAGFCLYNDELLPNITHSNRESCHAARSYSYMMFCNAARS
jgi:hypothetical protein